MIRQFLFGGLMSKIILACCCLAIWNAYNGNPVAIANKGWGLLEGGARVVSSLWNHVETPSKTGTNGTSPTDTKPAAKPVTKTSK